MLRAAEPRTSTGVRDLSAEKARRAPKTTAAFRVLFSGASAGTNFCASERGAPPNPSEKARALLSSSMATKRNRAARKRALSTRANPRNRGAAARIDRAKIPANTKRKSEGSGL